MALSVKIVKAKSALVKSNLPDTDYVINPYVGCGFGCSYCYASFMGRFVDKRVNDWGSYVLVKGNLAEVLDKQLARMKDKSKTVFISSVTDPYQGVEAKYKLTRQALEGLVKYKYKGLVAILTKSPLVTRDIDLIKKMNHEVGLTVTTTNDQVSRFFEGFAPPVSARIKTLASLSQAGLTIYAFIGPLFPHLVETPEEIEKNVKAIKFAGVEEVYVEHLNLSNYIKGRLLRSLGKSKKQLIDKFYRQTRPEVKRQLEELIEKMLSKYKIKLRLGQVIDHKN